MTYTEIRQRIRTLAKERGDEEALLKIKSCDSLYGDVETFSLWFTVTRTRGGFIVRKCSSVVPEVAIAMAFGLPIPNAHGCEQRADLLGEIA